MESIFLCHSDDFISSVGKLVWILLFIYSSSILFSTFLGTVPRDPTTTDFNICEYLLPVPVDFFLFPLKYERQQLFQDLQDTFRIQADLYLAKCPRFLLWIPVSTDFFRDFRHRFMDCSYNGYHHHHHPHVLLLFQSLARFMYIQFFSY